jgi:ankyrin repeat protein
MKIAIKLLETGADVNAAPAIVNGLTALDGAAERGRSDMVEMLLSAGAGEGSSCTSI